MSEVSFSDWVSAVGRSVPIDRVTLFSKLILASDIVLREPILDFTVQHVAC